MAESYRIATGVEEIDRPSGALGILRSPTQGSVRFRGLHPGLLSLLPPGAFNQARDVQLRVPLLRCES